MASNNNSSVTRLGDSTAALAGMDKKRHDLQKQIDFLVAEKHRLDHQQSNYEAYICVKHECLSASNEKMRYAHRQLYELAETAIGPNNPPPSTLQ